MNILIVTYKADISGGSNRSLLSIIDLLNDGSNNITLILPKKNGKMYDEANKRNIKVKYMHYSRIGARKPKSKLKCLEKILIIKLKLLHDYFYTLLNYRTLKKMKIDVVYSNGSAIHAGRYISRFLKVPHIWHIREFFEKTQIHLKNNYQIMAKDTDKFILISNDMFEEYKNNIDEKKLIMISNGIIYKECPEKEEHEGFNILLTGRINYMKNQMDAIKAMNNLINEHRLKDIKLFFAGSCVDEKDKEYKIQLEKYIKENNLESNIVFLGEVNDLIEIRKKMDIELMCSIREPFGRVTVEAMRSGLVIVGANSGGTKDIIIDGENGFFYELNNIGQLSNVIKKLFLDKNTRERIGKNARKFSRTHFTETQLQKTVDLIKNVVENARKGKNNI